MARIKGQANYASNFEVLKQAPLDSRSVVSESDDLIKKVTWQDADGNIWLYNGLMVVVPNTDTEKVPEVYILKKKEDYDKPETWVKLGADNATAVAAIQEALKKKANLTNGKVSTNELPIATSLGNPNNGTIPTTFAVVNAINQKITGLLNWKGVEENISDITDKAPAKKGDVWHANEDGSEWVCTQDITTPDSSAWTELGTPIDLSGYYTKDEVDGKVKPLADSIATKASMTELEGVRDKVNTLNDKVDKNAEAIGAATDSASVNGSLYARIKKNADDIATKASNSDLAALQSKVDNKANKTALDTLQTSVGNTSDAADASGSVYARIALNRKDVIQNRLNISTKASNADLEALASRVTGLEDGMPTAVQLVVKTI